VRDQRNGPHGLRRLHGLLEELQRRGDRWEEGSGWRVSGTETGTGAGPGIGPDTETETGIVGEKAG
jgi:hypothetical protein